MLREKKNWINNILYWGVIFVILAFSFFNFFGNNYFQKNQDFYFSDLVDRKIFQESQLFYWYSVLNVISKELQIGNVENAVIQSRIGHLYLDVFEASGKEEANVAVYRFFKKFFIHTDLFFVHSLENVGLKDRNLSKKTLEILNKYTEEFEKEKQKVGVANNIYSPTGKWKLTQRVGEAKKADTPGAKYFKKNFDYVNFNYSLVEPKYNYDKNNLIKELNILENNLQKRVEDNSDGQILENVLFWNAGRGAQSLAYVWQKVIYENNVSNIKKQVFLADVIADAYIFTFENKYKFQSLRPENYLENDKTNGFVNLKSNIVKTLKSPGFPSEQGVICSVTYGVLKNIDTRNENIYKNIKDECLEGRKYAGVEFEIDITEGGKFGSELSRFILDNN